MSFVQSSLALTRTKTKINIQQAALVGIAAVCTAALLGAFTANFAIVATSGLRIAATTAITPVAYFRFTFCASNDDPRCLSQDYWATNPTYIIKLTDQTKIDQARAILAGRETRATHVKGTIVKQPAEFNPVWHTYLDPASITFFEYATEVCDASIPYVETHYDEIGGAFLPKNIWCQWKSRLVEEVAYPSANNLALNKPVSNFLREVYQGTSKWTATDESYYKTYAEARGYTASKLTDGRWINLSSLAYGANFKYGFEIDLQQPTAVKSLKIYWGHFGESPAIHEVGDRNNKYYMQDYHVYAFTNNQWVQIAGKDLAPGERLTSLDLATATVTSKLRITSGVDVNGNWTKRAKNWAGVYELEVYGMPIDLTIADLSLVPGDTENVIRDTDNDGVIQLSTNQWGAIGRARITGKNIGTAPLTTANMSPSIYYTGEADKLDIHLTIEPNNLNIFDPISALFIPTYGPLLPQASRFSEAKIGTLTPGTYSLLVTIDANHQVAETNENNNQKQLTIIVTSCGNGTLEAGEACDDGNSVDTDTCRNNCKIAFNCALGPVTSPHVAGELFTTTTCTQQQAEAQGLLYGTSVKYLQYYPGGSFYAYISGLNDSCLRDYVAPIRQRASCFRNAEPNYTN